MFETFDILLRVVYDGRIVIITLHDWTGFSTVIVEQLLGRLEKLNPLSSKKPLSFRYFVNNSSRFVSIG